MSYLRMCWYYLFEYDAEKDGGLYQLTGWQHIRATDGPIHSMWVWWSGIRYHWIVLGTICRRKGHMRREEFVARSVRYSTHDPVHIYVSSCGRCGKYFGRGYKDIEEKSA